FNPQQESFIGPGVCLQIASSELEVAALIYFGWTHLKLSGCSDTRNSHQAAWEWRHDRTAHPPRRKRRAKNSFYFVLHQIILDCSTYWCGCDSVAELPGRCVAAL